MIDKGTIALDHKKARKAINALNRQHSKDMERRIARLLGGSRNRYSGMMKDAKSDCIIPLSANSVYLVECKYSSAGYKQKKSKIIFQSRWIIDLQKDVQSMQGIQNMSVAFGILVIKFKMHQGDYVFISEKDLPTYYTYFNNLLIMPISEPIVYTNASKNITLYKSILDQKTKDTGTCFFDIPDIDRYLIMPIGIFIGT